MSIVRETLARRDAEIARLKAECAEARNEAAVCRRAYLHERWRADEACSELLKHDPTKARELATKAYRGMAE